MGHNHLGTLPRSRKWNEVVNLLVSEGDLEVIAAASAEAAEYSLEHASNDQGFAHAFWLLAQIPQAARRTDFSEQLARLGLDVSKNPSLLEIVGAFTRAVDRHVQATGRRSDLGEMAQHAAAETLSTLVGRQLPNLFGSTARDVQRAFARFANSDQFSTVARDFFSRLMSHSLGYFLSRELSKHVGPEKRFTTIAEHREFKAALDLHCREASRIIKEYSRDWYGNAIRQEEFVSKEKANSFAPLAFRKIRAELRKRRDANG
jgi:hypothetical protein